MLEKTTCRKICQKRPPTGGGIAGKHPAAIPVAGKHPAAILHPV
jgi:hypothetical protein